MSERTLMVLDDEREICDLFERLGERAGFQVRTWQDPTQFLDDCSCGIDCGDRNDRIVLDIDLPQMDGIEVLRVLAERRCPAAILFVSGSAPRVLRSALELGKLHGMRVLGALPKPFSVGDAQRLLTEEQGVDWAQSFRRMEREAVEEDEVRTGLAEGQFLPYYQPQVCLDTGRVTGLEVLARWAHPRRGILAPGLFLPEIAHFGCVRELTDAMLRAGLRDLSAWIGSGEDLNLSFNFESETLANLDLPDHLDALCEEAGVDRARVCLEITESSMMEVPQVTLDVLARLALRGYQLAIDDFGTGWSTHEQLRRIPFTELKIDRTFVTDCLRNEAAGVILGSMVGLGRQLGLRVLAEGVESAEELAEVRRLGCHEVQGYYYSPPVPADEVAALIERVAS